MVLISRPPARLWRLVTVQVDVNFRKSRTSTNSSAFLRSSTKRRRSRLYVSASGDAHSSASGRTLTIIHFNDVYNVESRSIEPVGGASRFSHLVRTLRQEQRLGEENGDGPLVLFSGDCLNPSLMSAFTSGEQMVPVMNAIGVNCAAVGNHEFDFGVSTLRRHCRSFTFPWLLSNVDWARTGLPLHGGERSILLRHGGLTIGLMALVEREWLLTIPSIEEHQITYTDFKERGTELAADLQRRGADVIIALTHMRLPNDLLLASQVPGVHIVLGGHDHDYLVTTTEPHGTVVVKSGTDFREFSVVHLTLPSAPAAGTGSSRSGRSDNSVAEDVARLGRPMVDVRRVEVTSDVPEDPEVAAVVAKYQALCYVCMDRPLGRTFTPLDARFDALRTSETSSGNLFADIMRLSLGADAAFMNAGTVRSDQVHAAGPLTMRDFVSLLPFTDELVLLELEGAALLAALETGVGAWPMREGRFLQVSGIRFEFNPERPSGCRILAGSVTVGGEPLDLEGSYRVATKSYLKGGKDGFESLRRAQVLVDGETAPRLATLVQYLLTRIQYLNDGGAPPGAPFSGGGGALGSSSVDEDPFSEDALRRWSFNGGSGGSSGSGSDSEDNFRQEACARDRARWPIAPPGLIRVSEMVSPPSPPCAHGLDQLCFWSPEEGLFGVAPVVEGRVVRVEGDP